MSSFPSVLIIPTAACVCLVLAVLGQLALSLRNRRLRSLRAPWGRDDFVAYFSKAGISHEASGCLYDYFHELPQMQGMQPKPEDVITRLYGISGEDLADMYDDLCARLRCEIPEARRQDAIAVETIEELVFFITALPHRRDS